MNVLNEITLLGFDSWKSLFLLHFKVLLGLSDKALLN